MGQFCAIELAEFSYEAVSNPHKRCKNFNPTDKKTD